MTRRLSGLDAIFLSADAPAARLDVMAALVLDPSTIPGGYSFEKIREFLAARLHLVPPLRRRVVEVAGGLVRPVWVEDPDPDLSYHVRRAALPAPGDREDVAAFVSIVAELPLERGRPLWQMHVVEGLAGDRIALVAKLSHALMDGMAGMSFMAALFAIAPEGQEVPVEEPGRAAPPPGTVALLAEAAFDVWAQPLRLARVAVGAVRTGGRWARSWRRLGIPTLPFSGLRSQFEGPSDAGRSVGMGSVPLSLVAGIGAAADATVNDVMMAAVAGALRDLLAPDALDHPAVAFMPVSTRDDGGTEGNAVSVALVRLPTDENDPVRRLDAVREELNRTKLRREAIGGDLPARMSDLVPPAIVASVVRGLMRVEALRRLPAVANLIVSNVPGPPVPLYFAGARIESIYPFGPVYPGLAANLTMLGCEDHLDLGVVAGRRGATFAAALPQHIANELGRLSHAVIG